MKNRILSVIMGVITGWVLVSIGDMINYKLFPAPKNFDYTNKESLKSFIDDLPVKAFLIMLLFWAISVFVGGFVTGKIAKLNWRKASLITGGILLLSSIGNMLMIPQPIWMNIIVIIMYIPLAYLGGKIAANTSAH